MPFLTESSWTELTRFQKLQAESSTTDSQPVLSSSEKTVYGVLEQIHSSKFPFRFVVVGNGAILESTATIPVMKLNKSPQTGEILVTLCSEDQSFEFHIKTIQVSKIVFSQREANGKTLRIIRFLTGTATPMSSLILADDSTAAADWYHELRAQHGNELQL